MSQSEYLLLETAADILKFDRATGCLVSLRSKAVPDQEFIAWTPDHPAFVIGYLNEEREYRLLTSGNGGSGRGWQRAARQPSGVVGLLPSDRRAGISMSRSACMLRRRIGSVDGASAWTTPPGSR